MGLPTDKDRRRLACYRQSANRHQRAAGKLVGLQSGSARHLARCRIEWLVSELTKVYQELK